MLGVVATGNPLSFDVTSLLLLYKRTPKTCLPFDTKDVVNAWSKVADAYTYFIAFMLGTNIHAAPECIQ